MACGNGYRLWRLAARSARGSASRSSTSAMVARAMGSATAGDAGRHRGVREGSWQRAATLRRQGARAALRSPRRARCRCRKSSAWPRASSHRAAARAARRRRLHHARSARHSPGCTAARGRSARRGTGDIASLPPTTPPGRPATTSPPCLSPWNTEGTASDGTSGSNGSFHIFGGRRRRYAVGAVAAGWRPSSTASASWPGRPSRRAGSTATDGRADVLWPRRARSGDRPGRARRSPGDLAANTRPLRRPVTSGSKS